MKRLDTDILFILIKNLLTIIAFIVLAIVFNHWWISLFALLFMTNYRTSAGRVRICDKCGKRSPTADSDEDAIKLAKSKGWVHFNQGNLDYCPDCKDSINDSSGKLGPLNNKFPCNKCIHRKACNDWVIHGTTIYNDFEYSVEDCKSFELDVS